MSHIASYPPFAMNNEQGFTLLEALVTLVIVSIGLLGLLGLQTVSVANTQMSAARTAASLAADNMADRMRANPAGEADHGYEDLSPDTESENCLQNHCNAEALAAFDGAQWNADLNNNGLLPNGRGFVTCETKTGSDCIVYRITVVWREREADRIAASDECDEAAITDQCFATLVRP